MALGAEWRDVLKMVLREGARMVLLGVVIGLPAGLGVTRLMASLLFGVSPRDPLTLTGLAALLLFISLAGATFPRAQPPRSIVWWRCAKSSPCKSQHDSCSRGGPCRESSRFDIRSAWPVAGTTV